MTRWIEGVSRADWIEAGLTPHYFDMFASGKVTGMRFDYSQLPKVRLCGHMLGERTCLLLAEGTEDEVAQAAGILGIFGFPLHSSL